MDLWLWFTLGLSVEAVCVVDVYAWTYPPVSASPFANSKFLRFSARVAPLNDRILGFKSVRTTRKTRKDMSDTVSRFSSVPIRCSTFFFDLLKTQSLPKFLI